MFDESYPKLSGKAFQKNYIDKGSLGLQGFLKYRIKNGKNLNKTVRKNLEHYQSIRKSSLSIAKREEKFYEAFRNLEELYPKADGGTMHFRVMPIDGTPSTFADSINDYLYPDGGPLNMVWWSFKNKLQQEIKYRRAYEV